VPQPTGKVMEVTGCFMDMKIRPRKTKLLRANIKKKRLSRAKNSITALKVQNTR
jgi:hypothetical protein